MKRKLSVALVFGVISVGLVGCSKEAKTTKETTVSTPDGSTKVTEEKTVETTGENPPAVNK